MRFNKTVKSNQEQAIASWVNYLNQVRLDRLMEKLHNQNGNWHNAIETLDDTMKNIDTKIIERNRGGLKGMHGFIAEVAECGIGNAREQIKGNMPIYEWVNDNGPVDLMRQGIPIQQKFVASGNHLSLQAIAKHFEKYPDFLDQGGKYQIPEDHYDRIKYLLDLRKKDADKMSTRTGNFSMKQWREVHAFFDKGNIKLYDLEPSKLKYDQVQMNKIDNTLQAEKESLREVDREIRKEAYEYTKPSIDEEIKVTVTSAAIEASVTFVSEIVRKCKDGKKIEELDLKDWQDIVKKTGIGTAKGSIRGISIYSLTNYTSTPAAVASSLCTASFGIAEQAYLFRSGKITKDQFIANSELLCLETSVSALSSTLGQALIPIPVLGAVVGNTVGTIMYQLSIDALSKKEQKLIKGYLKELSKLDEELNKQYCDYLKQLNEGMTLYYKVLQKAFSPNYEEAFNGSIELALRIGVPKEELLISISEVDDYFMN